MKYISMTDESFTFEIAFAKAPAVKPSCICHTILIITIEAPLSHANYFL